MQLVSEREALKTTPSGLQPKLPSFILVKPAIEVAAGRELFSFLWHPFLLLMAVLSAPPPYSSSSAQDQEQKHWRTKTASLAEGRGLPEWFQIC